MNASMPELKARRTTGGGETFRVSLLEDSLHSNGDGMAVLELLEAMRKYHRIRDLSHRERHGAPDPQARQALSELGEVQQSLQALASSGAHDGEELVLEAALNLRMTPRAAAS